MRRVTSLSLVILAAPAIAADRPAPSVVRLPLAFERNAGQAPAGADFIAHASGYLLSVSGAEATLTPPGGKERLKLRMRGAAARAHAELLDPLPGRSHYFFGADPSRWIRNVPQYRRLRIPGVYPGISMTFYGKGDQLEYDFEVEAGADPRAIEMEFESPAPLLTADDGSLAVRLGGGEARLHAPLIYQRVNGELRPIRGRHRITGNRVRFDLGEYDRSLPVVIDPVLTYSTTFSGGRPVFNDVAVDRAGNTYLTGCAASGLPLVNAYLEEFTTTSDAILAKISADGTALLYSTYIGAGCASSVALDAAGNAILTGTTNNRYFPLRNPAYTKQSGGFLTKLSADGSQLLFSTFLGGDLTDAVTALALDNDGNSYVAGRTRAASFPSTVRLPALASPDADQPNARSGFVAKYSPDGRLLFSAILGAGVAPAAVAVNDQGAIHVGGALCGERYPVTADGTSDVPSGCRAFALKLAPGGAGYAYSYTFGGSAWDGVSQIALDPANNLYLSGITFSPDFPVSANAPQAALAGKWDAFAAKLNADGNGLMYATYLGGSREETPTGLAVDRAGRATVAGTTTSGDFPLADALRPKRNGAAEPLHSSDDGGASWTSVFSEGEQAGAYYPWRGSVTALAPTSDPRIVYSSDRFNIYRSEDGGATWQLAQSWPNQRQIRALLAHPSNPGALYAVTVPAPSGNASSVWYSPDKGATFTAAGSSFATGASDRLNLWISSSDPNVLYALIRRRTDPQLFRSADGGRTWKRQAALPDLFQSMVLDPSTTNRLYAGTDAGLYATDDGGATWALIAGTQCPADRMGPCQFQEMYADPSTPGAVLFTRRGGRDYGYTNQQLQIYRSADSGRTWAPSTTPVIGDAAAFAIDPADSNSWYVAFTGTTGLYRTSDGGQTWALLSPSAPFWTDTINALAVLPLGPSRVLAATAAGSEGFMTTLAADGGSWVESTYLGGAGNDAVTGLHADDRGWYVIVNNTLQRLESSSGGCDLVLTPSETTLNFLGGAARIQVRTGSSCAWRVDNPSPWISVLSPASGSGWGNIEIFAGANPSTAARVEKLPVNGLTLTVTQPGGPPCTPAPDVYRLIPSVKTRDGVAVNYTAGCQWAVSKDVSWVSLDDPVNGITTSVIPYTVDANTSPTARQTVLMFTARGGAVTATHAILQSAANCKVKVTASADSVPAAGGTVTMKLESDPANCSAWVADSGVSWATPAPGPVPGPGASALPGPLAWGTLDGSVTFVFQPNTSPAERVARLQMAGRGLAVTQAGAACAFVMKPATQAIDAATLQALVTVAAPAGCSWTASSDSAWLRVTSVTPTRGTAFSSATPNGNGRVYFTVDQNRTGAPRTGTITIASPPDATPAGKSTFTLTQSQ